MEPHSLMPPPPPKGKGRCNFDTNLKRRPKPWFSTEQGGALVPPTSRAGTPGLCQLDSFQYLHNSIRGVWHTMFETHWFPLKKYKCFLSFIKIYGKKGRWNQASCVQRLETRQDLMFCAVRGDNISCTWAQESLRIYCIIKPKKAAGQAFPASPAFPVRMDPRHQVDM